MSIIISDEEIEKIVESLKKDSPSVWQSIKSLRKTKLGEFRNEEFDEKYSEVLDAIVKILYNMGIFSDETSGEDKSDTFYLIQEKIREYADIENLTEKGGE